MEKLELKNLAPYLPYGLKIQYLENEIVELVGFNRNTIYHTTGFFVELPCNLKPILRPLSDLTKEIEHNGEKFVPIDKINRYGVTKGLYPKSYGICDREIYSDLTTYGGGCWEGGVEDDIDTFQFYELYTQLFEWHFDVFDLHSKGLCIYYNEL